MRIANALPLLNDTELRQERCLKPSTRTCWGRIQCPVLEVSSKIVGPFLPMTATNRREILL